jgi:hypothetical protein
MMAKITIPDNPKIQNANTVVHFPALDVASHFLLKDEHRPQSNGIVTLFVAVVHASQGKSCLSHGKHASFPLVNLNDPPAHAKHASPTRVKLTKQIQSEIPVLLIASVLELPGQFVGSNAAAGQNVST